jgi:hypothetical protein
VTGRLEALEGDWRRERAAGGMRVWEGGWRREMHAGPKKSVTRDCQMGFSGECVQRSADTSAVV